MGEAGVADGLMMEIRPLRADDGAAIHRSLLGDPVIAAWFRSGRPFTLAQCEEMVARKVAHRTVHRFGWVRSVAAYAREDNVASRGVMTKLGMRYEKSFDFDGLPHVLYRTPLAES